MMITGSKSHLLENTVCKANGAAYPCQIISFTKITKTEAMETYRLLEILKGLEIRISVPAMTIYHYEM